MKYVNTGEKQPLDAVAFLKRMKEKMALVNIEQTLVSRSLNEGFSGGEKKRNEIFPDGNAGTEAWPFWMKPILVLILMQSASFPTALINYEIKIMPYWS